MEECFRKSYVRCVVPSCLQQRDIGISFHKFPDKQHDKQRYKKWISALRLKYHPKPYSVVCSRHFAIGDFHCVSK